MTRKKLMKDISPHQQHISSVKVTTFGIQHCMLFGNPLMLKLSLTIEKIMSIPVNSPDSNGRDCDSRSSINAVDSSVLCAPPPLSVREGVVGGWGYGRGKMKVKREREKWKKKINRWLVRCVDKLVSRQTDRRTDRYIGR